MSQTSCYNKGKLTDQNFDLDQVSEHLAVKGSVVWIDLTSPSRDELELLAAEMKLDVLAVEDALEVSQRPKLDQ
jgi:magnesium transporter